MAKLNLYETHEQKVEVLTQSTHTQDKRVAMTVLYKNSWPHHKICRMFKMQPGKVNSKITLSLWFPPDQKYLMSMWSYNTMFSLSLMTGK